MSHAVAVKSRRTPGALAIATLVAVVAGVGVGTAIAPGGSDPARGDGGPRVGLRSGVAVLPLPAGWEPLGRRSSIPGLRDATAVRGKYSDVALDIRAPEHASLLPRAFFDLAAGQLLEPRLRRLDGRIAWRYDVSWAEPENRVVALTLPTTGGVVTIACEASADFGGLAGEECEGAMRALQVQGASVLSPAPETAVGIVLPETVDWLNAQRREGRRALVATRSPRARSAAAGRLGDAYARVARRLRPLARREARRLVVALAELARDHRALAAASRRRDAPAARRAGAAIAKGERRLTALIATVSRRGTQPTVRSAGYRARNSSLPSP